MCPHSSSTENPMPITIKLKDCLEANQYIDDNRWNHKDWHPRYDLQQTCVGRKYLCPVLIRLTDNLLSHLRKSFRINERWSNKYATHKSKINKIRLEQRTWRVFWIRQSNQLKRTSLNTQPATLPQRYTNLWGNKIRMSSLDMYHIQFSNTSEDKFQDQWTLILLMRTNRSTINDAKMITKTLKNNTWQIINRRNYYNL